VTPQHALSVIAQAAEMAPLPKAGHVQVEQALRTIAEALPEPEPEAAVDG
jgi:hypothetical protein